MSVGNEMASGLRYLVFAMIAFFCILVFGLFYPFAWKHIIGVAILCLLLNVVGIALKLKSKEKALKQLLISTNIFFLFFLILGMLLNTVESDLAKCRSFYALKFMNAGLIGLGISYLFFKAEKLGLGAFNPSPPWLLICTSLALGTGSFDIFQCLHYRNLALVTGIIGWIICPLIIITCHKIGNKWK